MKWTAGSSTLTCNRLAVQTSVERLGPCLVGAEVMELEGSA